MKGLGDDEGLGADEGLRADASESSGLLGGDEGFGDAGSGGDDLIYLGEQGEFEGMVPDSVDIEGPSVNIVSVRNLWCEEVRCRMCDAPRTADGRDTCGDCGTWQGQVLSKEDSEREAARLLQSSQPLSRSDINALLRTSLHGWSARARPCDKEAGDKGTSGWTLGQYVYGSQVGLTSETYRRPQLTRLLNRYLRQQVDSSVTWTALRVTCNYEAGPHVDCNQPDSLNVVVPVSWFEKGHIWIQGVPPDAESGPTVTKSFKGESRSGYLIGGSKGVACFDPRKLHAVEPAIGDRRVIVGYMPRLFNRLTESQKQVLHDLEFSLPCAPGEAKGEKHLQEQTKSAEKVALAGDTQELSMKEDDQAGLSPGGDGSNQAWEIERGSSPGATEFLEALHDQYLSLRRLEMDSRKHFDEELEISSSQNWTASADHLVDLKDWVHELEQWVITKDAELKLCTQVQEPEDRVLLARLQKLGVDTLEFEDVDRTQWVPLSGSPLVEPEGDSKEVGEFRPPGPKASEAVPAAPLQTVSVSHKEVLERVAEWKPSIGEELESVFERHRALQRTSKDEVDHWISQGKVVEYLPSKALFHRKGGTGRLKTRIVACGNFAKAGGGSEDHGSTYAGGIDSTTLRIQLSHCGRMKAEDDSWTTGALDIRTAFLLAPLEQSKRILVLRPPKVLISAGIVDPQELWYATGAMYGLREAPAAWSSYRDSQLPHIQICHGDEHFKLVKSNADQNLWCLKSVSDLDARPAALLGVYVDDMIATGPRAILDSLFCAIRNRWETSRPQFASEEGGILFCGLEIHDSGDRLHIHPRKYILDLLNRYPDIVGGSAQPGLKEPDEVPPHDRPPPDLAKVRLAQKLAGELLWIATKTRPDLIYVTSRIGQFVTRNVEFAIQLSHNALRYLRSTAHYEIIYGGEQGLEQGPDVGPLQVRAGALEAYADASFAPGNDRSQTGIILVWNQVPITWLSMRQPCASLSTAESELQSSIDALALTEGFLPLIQELEPQPVKTFLYNDNQGAVTVMKIPQGSWRTRHLRLKAAWFFEQIETSRYAVFHLPGKYMLGDLCTKTLQSMRIKELLGMMGMNIVDPVEGESRVAVVKKLESNLSSDCSLGSGSGGDESCDRREGEPVVLGELDVVSRIATSGEDTINGPVIPNVSLVKRALRLLLGALCLRRATGKITITIDELDSGSNATAWVTTLLVVLGVVLLGWGLTVGVGCASSLRNSPRIQSMRATNS